MSLKIKVIIGSIRDGRFADKPAMWIAEEAKKLEDAEVEVLDLKDYPMPFFAEAVSPSYLQGSYDNEVVQKWTAKIEDADAFIIVSPEYNHATSGVLKNAMDYVYKGWNNKAVGFVSYGSASGARAVENLRLIAGELQLADVRAAVLIPGGYAFGQMEWKPEADESLMRSSQTMLTQVMNWGKALKTMRENQK